MSSSSTSLRLDLSLPWSSAIGPGWLVYKLQGSPCFCLPRNRTTSVYLHAWLFLHRFQSLHSGPHAWEASDLSTEPSLPRPGLANFLCKWIINILGFVGHHYHRSVLWLRWQLNRRQHVTKWVQLHFNKILSPNTGGIGLWAIDGWPLTRNLFHQCGSGPAPAPRLPSSNSQRVTLIPS